MQSMVKHHTVSFSLLEHCLSIGITVVLVTGTNDFYTNLGTRGAALTESRNYFVTAQQRRQSKRIASLSIGRNNFTLHFRDESGAAAFLFYFHFFVISDSIICIEQLFIYNPIVYLSICEAEYWLYILCDFTWCINLFTHLQT